MNSGNVVIRWDGVHTWRTEFSMTAVIASLAGWFRSMRAPIILTVVVCALAVARAPQAQAEGADWLAELPAAAKIVAVYPASTPPEYALRQAAAAVLVDVIEVRAGVDQKLVGNALLERLTPNQRARWREYVNIGYSKVLSGTNGSWQMFVNPAFRADVLAHFISKASITSYEDARNRIPGVAGPSNRGRQTTPTVASPAPSPTFPATTAHAPDDYSNLTNAQMHDPEVLQALPHVGQEASAQDWLGRPAAAPWVDELPLPGRVLKVIYGSNPSDTALRQRDAFDILISIVHALGSKFDQDVSRGQPREFVARYVIEKRWLDKQSLYPAGEVGAVTVAVASRHKAVRGKVLASFFSEPSRALYRSTPEYGAPERESQFAQRREILSSEFAKDKAAEVDRKVFGIALGESLQLPICSGMFRSDTTCIDGTGQFISNFEAWGNSFAPGRSPVKVGTEVVVRIGDQACPDWLKDGLCRVYITVDAGYALGAHFWTNNSSVQAQALVKKRLEEKYGQPRPPEGIRTCRNRLTGMVVSRAEDWSWSKQGALYVEYSPLGGDDCARGAVEIETGAYRRLLRAAVQQHDAAEPKL